MSMEIDWPLVVATIVVALVYIACGILGQTPSGETKSNSA